ncbi:DNRLRE domain-containing protein [Sorangium sp. So ce1000]|uniref:DNRLRE domain-containing protein n=1 Tax=Sorangium sp. So ce1000 TaxID=3133325 RepID=UPI003F613E23
MVAPAVRLLAALVPVALLVAAPPLLGCGGAPATRAGVCAGAGVCGAGYCVAGRCRPAGALPAPIDARRVLLPPEDIAVLVEDDDAAAGPGVPDAVALGRAESGDVVLLLRFAPTFGVGADIASAFVVLEPAPMAPPAERALTLEVARILEPWRSETATWGRQPRLSIPEAAAIVRPRPATPLRIDVTALVRDWARRRKDDHGIAIVAPGSDAVGAAYSMGISQGVGPLLEVYVR